MSGTPVYRRGMSIYFGSSKKQSSTPLSAWPSPASPPSSVFFFPSQLYALFSYVPISQAMNNYVFSSCLQFVIIAIVNVKINSTLFYTILSSVLSDVINSQTPSKICCATNSDPFFYIKSEFATSKTQNVWPFVEIRMAHVVAKSYLHFKGIPKVFHLFI